MQLKIATTCFKLISGRGGIYSFYTCLSLLGFIAIRSTDALHLGFRSSPVFETKEYKQYT